MKVKVLKCSVPTFWYRKRIGEIFEVTTSSVSGCYDVKDCPFSSVINIDDAIDIRILKLESL